MKAVNGEKGIVEPTYVYLPGVPGGDAIAKETGVDFFSVPVELGVSQSPRKVLRVHQLSRAQPSGAEKAHNILGDLDAGEKQLLEPCKTGLKGSIEKGVEFVHNPPQK